MRPEKRSERERFIVSTSKWGLDRYSAGVQVAVLPVILLDVFNIFPVIYGPKWTLLIVLIIIVGFVRTQDPSSMLKAQIYAFETQTVN